LQLQQKLSAPVAANEEFAAGQTTFLNDRSSITLTGQLTPLTAHARFYVACSVL